MTNQDNARHALQCALEDSYAQHVVNCISRYFYKFCPSGHMPPNQTIEAVS